MATPLSVYTNLVLGYYKTVNEIIALPNTSGTYKRMKLDEIIPRIDEIVKLLEDKVRNRKNNGATYRKDHSFDAALKDALDLKALTKQARENLAKMP